MHATLAELLEDLKSGLLWVNRDGVVRYANGDASTRTGLVPGRKVYDPDLARAVSTVAGGGAPTVVTATGTAPTKGSSLSELACRVIPGLARDDAFVLIGTPGGSNGDVAFDNLMQVIRSDLADPLKQANEALSMLSDGADQHHVDALIDQVTVLTQLLDRLVELASIWGSGALYANDRIEFWPLVQHVWGELEPLALDRQVKVRFRAHGEVADMSTLYGSEQWLRRVLMECLESAIMAAPRGATLDIEHHQMGPRALLMFRDCGAFAPRSAGTVEFTRAKPGAASRRGGPTARPRARDQIGLRLCQHIIGMHGGHMREETVDGVRTLMIDLPTGAPHQPDQSQLDVAQAQQYARDLAALMARARRRSAQ